MIIGPPPKFHGTRDILLPTAGTSDSQTSEDQTRDDRSRPRQHTLLMPHTARVCVTSGSGYGTTKGGGERCPHAPLTVGPGQGEQGAELLLSVNRPWRPDTPPPPPDQSSEAVWCGSWRGRAGGLCHDTARDVVLDCWAAR